MSTSGTNRRWPFGLYAILTLLTLQAITQALLLFGVVSGGIPGLRGAYGDSGFLFYSWVGQLVFSLVALAGLWTRRSWGWTLFMIFLAFTMAGDIFEYMRGHPVYVSMFLNVLSVFYLNQHDVRSLFIEGTPPGRVP